MSEQFIELTTKPTINSKGITNTVHIEPYEYINQYTCSDFCDEYCRCHCRFDLCDMLLKCIIYIGGFLGGLIMLSIAAAITLGVMYGGYLVVLEGIKKQDYADSFDILGDCTITKAWEEESESCTTDSDGDKSCSTSYTSYYDFIVANTTFADNATYPCNAGAAHTDSQSGHMKYHVGQRVDCYTNEECHDLFMWLDNDHHTTAGWIFFGAALIFCYNLCCAVGTVIGGGVGALGSCVFAYEFCCGTDYNCDIKCSCLCICCHGYNYCQEKRDDRWEYYKRQWNRLAKWKQCDYIIGNWINHGEINRVTNDVCQIIVKYCSKDDYSEDVFAKDDLKGCVLIIL